MCACRPEEGIRSLIIDGCEPPCGCWELNSGPLEEQPVLLTSEPSLQPPGFCFVFMSLLEWEMQGTLREQTSKVMQMVRLTKDVNSSHALKD